VQDLPWPLKISLISASLQHQSSHRVGLVPQRASRAHTAARGRLLRGPYACIGRTVAVAAALVLDRFPRAVLTERRCQACQPSGLSRVVSSSFIQAGVLRSDY
jgi:hypothetical protein